MGRSHLHMVSHLRSVTLGTARRGGWIKDQQTRIHYIILVNVEKMGNNLLF